jgi:hypothetical protein
LQLLLPHAALPQGKAGANLQPRLLRLQQRLKK